MSMQFSVLASGSSGNALFLENGEQSFLVDAGLSCKQMVKLIEQIDRDPNKINGIFVTHEHSDHIKGIGVMARKYKLPIYANEKTWRAMEHSIGDVPIDQKFTFDMETVKTFGNLEVESFGVSHDAAEPMFYIFRSGGKKLVIITDTGYVSDRMKKLIADADVYIFESNHDVQMLQMSRYPWSVKQRILSDVGHVSNEDEAFAMGEVIGNNTSQIYLAHLSRDNNMKDLARMSVQQTLEMQGIQIGTKVELYDTDPSIPTKLRAV